MNAQAEDAVKVRTSALRYSKGPLYSMERIDSATYRIVMQGVLPFGWERHLTLGLSDVGVNILWGSIKRITRSQWQGELIVEPSSRAINMDELNIDDVIERGITMCKSEEFVVVLSRYELKDCIKDNGTLYVTVQGEDTLGFLAGLFAKFASCMLFPVQLDIGTQGGVIRDEFHLIGAAGLSVTNNMKENAEETLSALLK